MSAADVPGSFCFTAVVVLFTIFIKLVHSNEGSNSLFSVVKFSDASCGEQQQLLSSKQTRIVGGMLTSAGEFPWIVSIRHRGSHTCGGIVMNNKWIVTAAHCFCSGHQVQAKEKFEVVISREGFRNTSSQSLKIAHIKIHPSYSCSRLENDIALVQLDASLSWIDTDPACFPVHGDSPFSNLSNVKAVAVGWGATNEDLSVGSIPWMLHKVQVPILPNNVCQQWYESQNKTLRLHKSQMCAGYKDGKKDACWADSGGPLMVKNGVRMVVVGIVSTGIGCARASLPGIYTRLSEYVDWMADAISSSSFSPVTLRHK